MRRMNVSVNMRPRIPMTTARLGWKSETTSPEEGALCALTWENMIERTKRLITPSWLFMVLLKHSAAEVIIGGLKMLTNL